LDDSVILDWLPAVQADIVCERPYNNGEFATKFIQKAGYGQLSMKSCFLGLAFRASQRYMDASFLEKRP